MKQLTLADFKVVCGGGAQMPTLTTYCTYYTEKYRKHHPHRHYPHARCKTYYPVYPDTTT